MSWLLQLEYVVITSFTNVINATYVVLDSLWAFLIFI